MIGYNNKTTVRVEDIQASNVRTVMFVSYYLVIIKRRWGLFFYL